MRLAVTFLILAVFVPAAAAMTDGLEKDSAVSAANTEADKIADAVKRAYYAGAGSKGTLSVSLPGGSCLLVGGEGSDSYCISVLIDDTVAEKHYLQRPAVRILGEPAYISGSRTVSVECMFEDGIYGVEVSVVD